MHHLTGSSPLQPKHSASTNLAASGGKHVIVDKQFSLREIAQVIFSRLHPLYGIDCGVILIYDDQRQSIKEALVSKASASGKEIDLTSPGAGITLNGIQDEIAQYTFPVLKTNEEWLAETGTKHCLINGESAYHYHCYLPMEVNDQLVGTLELHHLNKTFTADCLTFCSNIADLLAQLICLQASAAEVVYQAAEQLAPDLKAELQELRALKMELLEQSPYINEEPETLSRYPEIVGSGAAMQQVFTLMDQVACSSSTVLILGESGTGKELIARAIHDRSERRDQPLVKVNCAAIPANLMESELFGHEKGAFTGATALRPGKFELAHQGTLFLDEIGEISPDLQVKLLRVLQEKEFERVGGNAVLKADVRIIAATNRDLLYEVEQGRFRRDLYYRLNVFPIKLPSLRERSEDIPLLASHFLDKYSKQPALFTQRVIRQLSKYTWPGNVREMEHLIERQVLLSNKAVIGEIDLPSTKRSFTDKQGVRQQVKTIDENERDHIFAVLQLCKGRISGKEGAAQLLGVPATTLNSKIKRLGISKKHF